MKNKINIPVKELGVDYLKELFLSIKFRTWLFHEHEGHAGTVLLRHDVDDDLQRSVAMAELEAKHGVFATYFILNTAPYWNPYSEELFRQLRYIQEMGHEIGWHNNAITQWVKTKKPMRDIIAKPLKVMRDNGLKIYGSASHGDQLCHQLGYINYEVFTHVRRDCDHNFKDGKLPFERLAMADFGLEYEAYHVSYNQYFSESGGTWSELPAPEDFKDQKAITQILIHPQWWNI